MRVVPALSWRLDAPAAAALDPRVMPLLEAIARSSSLAAAVDACGISYRAGWGVLRDYQRLLGVPLVLLERGRGARLTAAGERLVGAQRAATERLARVLPGLAIEIGPVPRQEKRAPTARLSVVASHDLALEALANALPAAGGIELDVSFMGSLHALKEFAEGRADVAGFHVPIGGRAPGDRAPFLQRLRPRSDRLIRFVDREQGLILARGNPLRIKTFREIAVRGLRFVNRQRGSGTRLVIERMIADARIDPMDLTGYAKEEFTHAAVAATVASGGADAGFGLRAAAAEYGLAFVPVVRERYFLAVHARNVETAGVRRLIAALRGPAFARLVRQLPGYTRAGAGSVVGPEVLAARAPR
jgi:molybdate transport repressor ModE-like protein